MSHRTKLLIATLFLVLLAIPAAYVILTWTTSDPLRFQIIAYHEPSSPQAWPAHGKLELRVENTSHLPVHLDLSSLRREGHHPRAAAQLYEVSSPTSGDTLVIPPRSSASCAYKVLPKIGSSSPWDNVAVSYSWRSGTKVRYDEICHWLYDYTPPRLQKPEVFIHVLPKYNWDTTKLAPAKP